MEKLVDIVQFLHVEIQDTFGPCGKVARPLYICHQTSHGYHLVITTNLSVLCSFVPVDGESNESQESRQTLGSAGLSLHYANIISQIDNIVSVSCLLKYILLPHFSFACVHIGQLHLFFIFKLSIGYAETSRPNILYIFSRYLVLQSTPCSHIGQ